MVEFLVATAISLLLIAAAVAAFTDALRSNEAVTLTADLNDNLRAAMDLISRDLVFAGQAYRLRASAFLPGQASPSTAQI